MFIDLKDIDREGVRFDTALALGELRGPGEERYPVTGARIAGRVVPARRGFELRARLRVGLKLPCSRCLEPYPIDIDEDVFLIVVHKTYEFAREIEVGEEEAVLYRAEGGRVELRDLALEQIYLQLPLKPVCREDCRGLCPDCGANRNLESCDCREGAIDPRLAPLLEFKKKGSST